MPQKIEYGTRKNLGVFKSQASTPRPIYLLLENTRSEIIEMDGDSFVPASKCFCPECQKVQDLSTQVNLKKNGLTFPGKEKSGWADIDLYSLGYISWAPDHSDPDVPKFEEISCPQCGHSGPIIALHQTEREEGKAWQTPKTIQTRSLSKSMTEDGRTTRIDDCTRFLSFLIKENESVEKVQNIINETSDLIKNDIYVTTGDIREDGTRENQAIFSCLDPYLYPDVPSMDPEQKYGVHRLRNSEFGNATYAGFLGWNRIIQETFGITGMEPKVVIIKNGKYEQQWMYSENTTEFNKWGEKMMRQKASEIETRFDGMADPVFCHGNKNGMYLQEHHPGSNEENTKTDLRKIQQISMLMVRYPAVYLHAVERTERLLEDKHYAEMRKQKANPDYEIKTPSDSGKARLFRSELNHVSEELCAADDKITKTAKSAKTPKEMRQKLEFFVYGPNGERDIPKNIKAPEGTTMNDPFKATKTLKRAFIQEPLAVASNVYTGTKLKLKTTDHLNQLMQAGAAFSETDRKRARRHGNYVMVPPPESMMANAGVVAPIRSADMMSFMKKFAGTHNPTDTVQMLYGDSVRAMKNDTTTGYGLLVECLRMYGTIIQSAKIADQPDEIKNNFETITKRQIANYLENKPLSQGYVDFVEKFGPDTFNQVNRFAAMVLEDKKKEAAIECVKTEGMAVAKMKHPILGSEADPDAAVAAWKEEMAANSEIILTTRNGKPLFQNRTLREIHDELSVMSTKCLKGNQTFKYSENERSLERSYPAPDADGEWSFHLMKDSNDLVRTATQMYNCVGGQTYVDEALNKSGTLLYMQDETAQRVGCIELKPKKRNDGTSYWEVLQFQGPHDNVISNRFTSVAKQWLTDCKINYAGCADVQKFGTEASIYGDHDADFHRDEVDEAEGIKVDKKQMQSIQERRTQMAKEYYGLDADGNIAVPTVPEELQEFM